MKASALVAGLIGGIVSLTYEEKLSFGKAIILILTGAACAAYITPLVELYIDFDKGMGNAFSFLIGLISMRLIGGVLVLADKWKIKPSLTELPKIETENETPPESDDNEQQ